MSRFTKGQFPVSTLACVETAMAVAAYWLAAWYFETLTHIVVSVFLAPFSLLQSRKSITEGLNSFDKFLDPPEIRTGRLRKFFGTFAICAPVLIALIVASTHLTGEPRTAPFLFGLAFCLGYLTLTVETAYVCATSRSFKFLEILLASTSITWTAIMVFMLDLTIWIFLPIGGFIFGASSVFFGVRLIVEGEMTAAAAIKKSKFVCLQLTIGVLALSIFISSLMLTHVNYTGALLLSTSIAGFSWVYYNGRRKTRINLRLWLEKKLLATVGELKKIELEPHYEKISSIKELQIAAEAAAGDATELEELHQRLLAIEGLAIEEFGDILVANDEINDRLSSVVSALLFAETKEQKSPLNIYFATMGSLGIILGYALRAFSSRFYATYKYFTVGVKRIPGNWYRMVFCARTAGVPELIPGLNYRHPEFAIGPILSEFVWSLFRRELRFEGAPKANVDDELAFTASNEAKRLPAPSTLVRRLEWRSVHSGSSTADLRIMSRPTFSFLCVILFFAPSIFYRFSLKSTFWFYVPLAYLFAVPGWFRVRTERRIRERQKPAPFDYAGVLFAVTSLAVLAIGSIDQIRFYNEIFSLSKGVPFTVFNFLFVLDTSNVQIWHYFSIASAALYLIDFNIRAILRNRLLASDSLSEKGMKTASSIGKLRSLDVLRRFRVLCVVAWLLVSFAHFLNYSYSTCRLPDFIYTASPFGSTFPATVCVASETPSVMARASSIEVWATAEAVLDKANKHRLHL